MAGIVSYGAYIPPTRLPLALISGQPAHEGGPEKAVAWNDEDSISMAVTAAVNCLRGIDRATVDAIFFASTTCPFREKQAASLVAKALDLRRDVRSADQAGSLRAGTAALRCWLIRSQMTITGPRRCFSRSRAEDDHLAFGDVARHVHVQV